MKHDIDTEVFIITHDEMKQLKEYALTLIDKLPNEPMTALLTITFLKKHMENEIGKSANNIVVK